MYETYWQLTDKPFPYRLNPTDAFAIGAQQSAMLRLQYCIQNSGGCAMLLGESGLGKTMLQRQLESSESSLQPFVYLAFPALEPIEHLRLLVSELANTPATSADRPDQLLQQIRSSLQQSAANDRHPVICFDDAQLLSTSVLTEVILPLMNLRDIDDQIDFTVILAGQPILTTNLQRHPQLRERVAVTATLSGMNLEEVHSYVTSRLEKCGRTTLVFSDEALLQLHHVSQGNPRRLNRLCDMALLVGCAEKLAEIEAGHIESVGTELLTAA